MTKETLAALLNGREYGDEITREEEAQARAAGLVAVFGYSDDNAELRGAIHDEVGCGDGGTFMVGKSGVIPEPDRDELEVLEKFGVLDVATKSGRKIKAIWSRGDYSWQYETDIPHATFEIFEEGGKYCRGIVFAIADLAQ